MAIFWLPLAAGGNPGVDATLAIAAQHGIELLGLIPAVTQGWCATSNLRLGVGGLPLQRLMASKPDDHHRPDEHVRLKKAPSRHGPAGVVQVTSGQ